MTVWLLHQALSPQDEETIAQRTHLILPFYGLPDLSRVHTQGEARQLLQAIYPDDPPESITHKVEAFWPRFHNLHLEDIIAVPLSSRRELAIAEVTGHYQYRVGEEGEDIHLVPVKWHPKRAPYTALRKHKEIYERGTREMFEIGNADARAAIRDRLPHRYNRFAKWKWLLTIFFLLGMLRMILKI